MDRGSPCTTGARPRAAPVWDLPRHPTAARLARRALSRELVDLPGDCVEVAQVLTSELVTNAVRHGRGAITLRVAQSGRGVIVTVADQGADLPVLRDHDLASKCGRGMQLVDALAAAWGTRPVGAGRPGKEVWFTLDA